MKNFKQKFMEVLQSLGLTEKAKSKDEAKGLSEDDWKNIRENYKATHGTDFAEDMAAEEENAQKAQQHDAALAILNVATTVVENNNTEEVNENTEVTETPPTVDLSEQVSTITQENKALKDAQAASEEKIRLLSEKIEPKKPEAIVKGGKIPYQKAHTDTHVYGIEHDLFSMDKRWNKIAANSRYAKANALSVNQAQEVEKSFLNDLKSYGGIIGARYQELKDNNQLGQIKSAAFDVDYSELDALTKNQYVIRRTDALIAQILQVKTIFDLFPRRYGVQDYDIITNALFSEVSSAWQSGKIFKGDVDLQPETGHVDDATIKIKFEPLTDMERKFIGYLNQEGSDPVKWTMIEWYAMQLLEKAVQEQTKRYVMGIYYKPETGVPGSYLNASTGIIHTIQRYINSDKMLDIPDVAVRDYDSTTMYAVVKAFLDLVEPKLEPQEWDEFTLVLNKRHRQWFINNLRTEFGTDNDFMGTAQGAMMFPDYDIPIYWLSGLATNDYTMLLTKPGNIQCIENIPGEMMGLIFEGDFEDVTVRSRWKEGTSAAFVGPRFSTPAELVANDYYQQQIFINKAVFALADGETAPDAANGYRFITVANTAATEILDVANAKKGPGYYIEIGSLTNPSTITKALKFSEITADWTPTALGDYILVVLNDAGDKFLELERKVGGVRSSNSTLQPTLPENRS